MLTLSIKNDAKSLQRTKAVPEDVNSYWNESFEYLCKDKISANLIISIIHEDIKQNQKIVNEFDLPFENWTTGTRFYIQKDFKFNDQESGILYFEVSILDENLLQNEGIENIFQYEKQIASLRTQISLLTDNKNKLEKDLKMIQNEKKDVEKEIYFNCTNFISCLNDKNNQSRKIENYLKKMKANMNKQNEIETKNSNKNVDLNENYFELRNKSIFKMTNDEKKSYFNELVNEENINKFNISVQEFVCLTQNINNVTEKQFDFMIDYYNNLCSKNDNDRTIIFVNLTEIDIMMLRKILKLDGFSICYLSQKVICNILNRVLLYDDLFHDLEQLCFLNEKLKTEDQNRKENYLKTSKKSYYSLYNQIYKEIKIFDGSTCIEKYLFDGYPIEKVYIPSSVLEIHENAFYNCRNLTTVSLNCINLTKIGKSAFSGCKNLKTFIMPEKVEIIEEFTFKKCVKLESIVFPPNLKEIKEKAFASCKSLTEIKLPSSIQKLGSGVFKKCESLKLVVIPGILTIFPHDDVPQISEESPIQNFCIPSKCFYKCKELYNVIVHKKCQIIDDSSFSSCSKLENVILNISPQFKIGNSAFENCEQIKKVKIIVNKNPSLEFGNSSFQNCKELKEFSFDKPYSFPVTMNANVFKGCENLEKFEFPLNCNLNIGESCFNGCKNLKSVMLPANLTKISKEMFKNCENLESIKFEGENLTVIEESSFENCSKLKLNKFPSNLITISDCAFKNCSLLNFVNFPEKVEKIGRSSFEKCSQIFELVIPLSMKIIDKKAFQNCSELQKVTNYSSALVIKNKAFNKCVKLKRVYTNNHDGFSTEAFENCAVGLDFFKIENI